MTTKAELSAQIEALMKRVDALEGSKQSKPEAKGPWKPKVGETYYIIDVASNVRPCVWKDDELDKAADAQGNVYHTRAEADKVRDRKELLTEMRCFAGRNGWVPDWKDDTQDKYNLGYDHSEKKWYIVSECCHQWSDWPVYQSHEDANEALRLFGDWLHLLLGE